MDPRPGSMIAIGFALAFSACGALQPQTKSLEMLSLSSHVPTEQRWAYLQASLAKEGWQIERSDPARSEMVAFKSETGVSDMREHLVVKLGPATSAAMIQSELRLGDRWKATPVVCRSYSYAREKQIIGGMEEFLAVKGEDVHLAILAK
jgi:hypothetical protein